jgi:hypothetical protein
MTNWESSSLFETTTYSIRAIIVANMLQYLIDKFPPVLTCH